MIQNNNYNSFNQNIKNQGGPLSWVGNVNEEIFRNLGLLDNIDIQHRDELNAIKKDLNEKQIEIDKLKEDYKIFQDDALSQLSKYYDEHAIFLDTEREKWFKYSKFTFLGIFIFDLLLVLSFTIPTNYWTWFPHIKYDWSFISLGFFEISAIWFLVSQYSNSKKLFYEYKNRSVVSRSYFGFLNQAKDEKERSVIAKIISDTLFSRNVTDQMSELPIKEVAKIFDKVSSRT